MCALKIKHWKQSHQKEKQKIDCWELLETIQDYGEWWTIELVFLHFEQNIRCRISFLLVTPVVVVVGGGE